MVPEMQNQCLELVVELEASNWSQIANFMSGIGLENKFHISNWSEMQTPHLELV